jgi:hypothetical protein
MSRTAQRTATYLYCVGLAAELEEAVAALGVPGVGGHEPVRALVYDDLAALVSDVPGLRVDISRRNLQAHQRVLEAALAHATVLPVSFGTIATGDEAVLGQLLRREADELRRQLAWVQGCIELNVMVLWEQERVFQEIIAEDRAIRDLRDSLLDVPDDAAYYERIELGQRTAAAMQAKSQLVAGRILDRLEPLAVEVRLNDPVTDLMLLNAAFLVERAREPAFDAAMQALGAEADGRLQLRYIGPLPPHNFISLSITWEA